MKPEEKARLKIDHLLREAGWEVQDQTGLDLNAGVGVAVREYKTEVGPADYILFVDRKPVGVIEAKKEEEGVRLTVVEGQSAEYAASRLKYLHNDPLPFVYESTGALTRFTDYRDPKPRSRPVFRFHRPETFREGLKKPPRCELESKLSYLFAHRCVRTLTAIMNLLSKDIKP